MRILLVALGIAFCAATAVTAGEINLSAAASLKDVVNELANDYARKNPGSTFVKNFGGSGALAKQIENGARTDIFISANQEWIAYLHGKKLLDNPEGTVLAYNSLVFVGPPGKKTSSLKELTGLERIAIGSPKSVPAGEYAMEALRRAGVAMALEKKLVLARDVRECLMYAERGEVDGAFVYRTDALPAKRVAIHFVVPQELYRRVSYRMGLTPSGTKNREAAAFFNYLQSSTPQTVLAKYGFDVK
ncbi:MAG TPA: molybdate ABC transporter substrate-binding protein [Geobacteraceae bacterium]|nr:molybdate ABC transporter substrate-binding protein [Geobacteraceae bacterium]